VGQPVPAVSKYFELFTHILYFYCIFVKIKQASPGFSEEDDLSFSVLYGQPSF